MKGCTVCKKKSKISGTMKGLKGFKTERLLAVGGGAIAAKALTNPLLKVLKMDGQQEGIKKYAAPAIKIIGGYFAMKQKDQMIKDAGLGAVAAGLMEFAEIAAPQVFAPLAANTMSLTPIKGIGAPVQYLDLEATGERVAGFEEMERIAGGASLGGRF